MFGFVKGVSGSTEQEIKCVEKLDKVRKTIRLIACLMNEFYRKFENQPQNRGRQINYFWLVAKAPCSGSFAQ